MLCKGHPCIDCFFCNRIPSISEDRAREALRKYVSSKCCYRSSPVNDGVITNMETFNTYRVRPCHCDCIKLMFLHNILFTTPCSHVGLELKQGLVVISRGLFCSLSVLSIVWRRSQSPDHLNGAMSRTQVVNEVASFTQGIVLSRDFLCEIPNPARQPWLQFSVGSFWIL